MTKRRSCWSPKRLGLRDKQMKTIEELKEDLIEMIDEAEDESMLYEDDNSFSTGVVVGRRNALQDVMDLIESKKD